MYDRIACCFKCCLLKWIEELGLDANEAHWRQRGVNFFIHQGSGGKLRSLEATSAPIMARDFVLHPRFAVARFAHFQAIESRDLALLNDSTPRAVLRSGLLRVPHAWRANGTLVALNGWGHGPPLLRRISESLPAGPTALLYGDDETWEASELQAIRDAFSRPLVRHFAMNIDEKSSALPWVQQVPIGLNSASASLASLLAAPSWARTVVQMASADARSPELVCCCQRPWPHRARAFEALRAAGHTHCNLSERIHYEDLFTRYTRHRFVVSVWGHGHSDFREWEILLAGAVPVVQRFAEHGGLLEGLPVVRVDDWSTVTPAFLEREWARLQREAAEGKLSWTKVFFPYWLDQFTAHMGRPHRASRAKPRAPHASAAVLTSE